MLSYSASAEYLSVSLEESLTETKFDCAEGELRDSRTLGEAASPAMCSHPDSSGPVTKGRNPQYRYFCTVWRICRDFNIRALGKRNKVQLSLFTPLGLANTWST